MKRLAFFVVLCFFSVSAFAQTGCPDPTLQVLSGDSALNLQESSLPPKVVLVLQDESSCAEVRKFEVTGGKMYLVRDYKPLATKTISGSSMDMSDWAQKYRAGDRIVIEISDVFTLSDKGEKQPYNYGTVISWRLK